MKELSHIIKSLTKEELRNFKLYTSRIDSGEDKKNVQLFDFLKEEKYAEDDNALINELFPSGDKNPYYRLKNRLFDDIEKSLVQLHSHSDDRLTAISYLMLAQHFENKKESQLCIFYLEKAEKKALKNDYFDVLEIIYDAMVRYSETSTDIDTEEVVKKYNDVLDKSLAIRKSLHTSILINSKLRKSNFSGKETPEKKLNEIMSELNISGGVQLLPSVRLSNHECIRDVLLVRKQFKQLEEYLIKSLEEFERDKLFTETNHAEKLKLFAWIINTLNKNRRFSQAAIYNEIYYQELIKYDKRHYDDFIFSYYQCLVINHIISKNYEKAINLLEELKQSKTIFKNQFHSIFLNINLISLYYLQNNLNQAIKNLVPLLQKETMKQLLPEMQLTVGILELILQYELGDTEYVENRIHHYERSYKEELATDAYKREKMFISLIKYSISKEGGWKNKYTLGKAEDFLSLKNEFEFGSNEVIDYSLWVRAKLYKEDYTKLYEEAIYKK